MAILSSIDYIILAIHRISFLFIWNVLFKLNLLFLELLSITNPKTMLNDNTNLLLLDIVYK